MKCEKCDHLEKALVSSNDPWVKKIYWRLFGMNDRYQEEVCAICRLPLDHKEKPDKESDNIYRLIRL
jgi:hypothetical protein